MALMMMGGHYTYCGFRKAAMNEHSWALARWFIYSTIVDGEDYIVLGLTLNPSLLQP
jgi:hypothetical protein